MEKVTFVESIVKILEMISSVPFLIEILILTIILLIAMIFFYFKKSKKGKITTLLIYFSTLILLPISHISFFVDSIDKIIENFVKIVYFPSWYIYLIMLIITNASVLKELVKAIKEEKTKWLNAFNFAYFFIFQFLFFLIVRIVSTNDINIFETSEIYNNSLLLSVIQISSYLFWIRIGIKLLILIINKLSDFQFKTKEEKIEDFTLRDNSVDLSDNIIHDTPNVDFDNNNNNNNSVINAFDYLPLTETVSDQTTNNSNQNLFESNTLNNIGGSVATNLEKEEEIEILDFDLEKNNDNENDNYFDDFYG